MGTCQEGRVGEPSERVCLMLKAQNGWECVVCYAGIYIGAAVKRAESE